MGHFSLSVASSQTERLTPLYSFKRKGLSEFPWVWRHSEHVTWSPSGLLSSLVRRRWLRPLLGKGGKALILLCPFGHFRFYFHLSLGWSEGMQLVDPALICDAQCHSHCAPCCPLHAGAREPADSDTGVGKVFRDAPPTLLSPGHDSSVTPSHKANV